MGTVLSCTGSASRRAARVEGVIPRYTRPEIGAVWTDQAKMEAWRLVEVAACEEMEGPTPADLDAIRAATFTVEAAQEREKITDHDVAAFVDVLSASAGGAGGGVHFRPPPAGGPGTSPAPPRSG